jgi:hypothetical protein
VILRNDKGIGELCGQLFSTQDQAERNAKYWSEHYTGPKITGEWVEFQVPLRGQPVVSAKDMLPIEKKAPAIVPMMTSADWEKAGIKP